MLARQSTIQLSVFYCMKTWAYKSWTKEHNFDCMKACNNFILVNILISNFIIKRNIKIIHFGHIHLLFPHFCPFFLCFSPVKINKPIKMYLHLFWLFSKLKCLKFIFLLVFIGNSPSFRYLYELLGKTNVWALFLGLTKWMISSRIFERLNRGW